MDPRFYAKTTFFKKMGAYGAEQISVLEGLERCSAQACTPDQRVPRGYSTCFVKLLIIADEAMAGRADDYDSASSG